MAAKTLTSILKHFHLQYKWESSFLEDDLAKCNKIPKRVCILCPKKHYFEEFTLRQSS